MLEPIATEQTFVTNLEKFLSVADNFVRRYYSGESEDLDMTCILEKITDLASDATAAHREFEQELIQERKDLIADYHDSSWA
ncbi:hypothetical protein Cylst_5237 [Cylindrospermum stagnale PCC 7417]|uniref:Uncharacterized protein n=1 Tax=Cylindrospermum stagnale PCC 7417 TaxID=56107 RepID=K9X5C4_9NOST|nr:hypothetical protein [Cylindrospermum stagnale]AFZ27271.1 hypothetical protein Cylst_5237 [Cylindrospermum stagnale PCC 7417]